MPRQIDEGTHFMNVDLDIYSMSDLQPLVTALGERVYVLPPPQSYEAHLELTCELEGADGAIRKFAALIDALPGAQREIWDAAKSRDFNIGVQTAVKPVYYVMPLSCEAVEAAARLNARIVFTVYPPEATKEVVWKKRAPAGGKGR